MIQRYTKKPVTIEAIQWTKENVPTILEWIPKESIGVRIQGAMDKNQHEHWNTEYYILTLEGEMTVTEGDYIIKGVKGEFYPCKPDIFEMTYQLEAKD